MLHPQQNDLEQLLQLAQLGQVIQKPQQDQQQMQMTAALHMLGLNQQNTNEQSRLALDQQRLGQEGDWHTGELAQQGRATQAAQDDSKYRSAISMYDAMGRDPAMSNVPVKQRLAMMQQIAGGSGISGLSDSIGSAYPAMVQAKAQPHFQAVDALVGQGNTKELNKYLESIKGDSDVYNAVQQHLQANHPQVQAQTPGFFSSLFGGGGASPVSTPSPSPTPQPSANPNSFTLGENGSGLDVGAIWHALGSLVPGGPRSFSAQMQKDKQQQPQLQAIY